MAEKSMTPEIRFKGFTDPWEQRKLGDCVVQFKDPIPTPTNGYVRMGVRSHAKGTFLAEVEPGAQIEEKELSRVRANCLVVNIVFAWEHAVAITTEEDAKALVSHRFPQFQFCDEMLPGFFRYVMLDERFRHHLWLASPSGAGRNKTLSIGAMLDYMFLAPNIAEQRLIGAYFSRLDSLITLHQRKHDKLVQLKKAMLDKMFPKPGELVPEIRFKGFTDPWEQRKLGDCVVQFKDPIPTPTNGYVRMGVRSHAKGTFLAEVEPGAQIEEKELSRVRANCLVVNIVFAWEHAVAITTEEDAKALVSHRFPQFQFCDEMLPGFFRYVMLDERFRHHLWLASPSGAGRNKTLSIGAMLDYMFLAPNIAEQRLIGAYFSRLDSLITLHQRKLELLRNIKKAMLDKMFV